MCAVHSGCGAPTSRPDDGDVRLVPLQGTTVATGECDNVHFGGVELFFQGQWGRICSATRSGIDRDAEFTLDAHVNGSSDSPLEQSWMQTTASLRTVIPREWLLGHLRYRTESMAPDLMCILLHNVRWYGLVSAALLPAVGTCVVLVFGAMPGR